LTKKLDIKRNFKLNLTISRARFRLVQELVAQQGLLMINSWQETKSLKTISSFCNANRKQWLSTIKNLEPLSTLESLFTLTMIRNLQI
jgi:hypothetical protein